MKIADLAIFSLGIKNAQGAQMPEEFTVSKHIRGVKLRARATGDLITRSLRLEASLKKASATTKGTASGGSSSSGGNDDQPIIERP